MQCEWRTWLSSSTIIKRRYYVNYVRHYACGHDHFRRSVRAFYWVWMPLSASWFVCVISFSTSASHMKRLAVIFTRLFSTSAFCVRKSLSGFFCTVSINLVETGLHQKSKRYPVILRLRQLRKRFSCCECLPAEISPKHNGYFYRYSSVSHSSFCIRCESSSWFQHKVAYSWQMAVSHQQA